MDLSSLVQALKSNPSVIGIVNYGSRAVTVLDGSGDVDLLVIVDEAPDHVESLHVWVGDTPVDLNIRALCDLQADIPLTPFDCEMASGTVVYDRDGTLQDLLLSAIHRWNPRAGIDKETDIAFARFGLSHAMHKAQSHLHDDPCLAQYVMSTQLFWVVHTYLTIAGQPFRGEKKALNWLRDNKPEVYANVERFLGAATLEEMSWIYAWLTHNCLEPVGGAWSHGDMIALARDRDCVADLESEGYNTFRDLLQIDGTE